jgi:geranylgeranyl diphosphate synthase type II
MDFVQQLEKMNKCVSDALDDYLGIEDSPGSDIYKAMKYSLMAGGKRLRPILAIAVCDILGGNVNTVMPYACAIEMIHTYSLIHDDLPAMDNDDYRRGVPTNHKVFGEAMAILAGDALLNEAFELMLKSTAQSGDKLEQRVEAMRIIAECSGANGMIRGQVIDLESEGRNISKETLEYMHRCKTGAMIKAPVLSSAVLCDADKEELLQLEMYAENIGLAFQIKDDIMDVNSSLEEMGKVAGRDAACGKTTYVTLYGVDKANELLDETISEAVKALDLFGVKADFLKKLAVYIKDRSN